MLLPSILVTWPRFFDPHHLNSYCQPPISMSQAWLYIGLLRHHSTIKESPRPATLDAPWSRPPTLDHTGDQSFLDSTLCLTGWLGWRVSANHTCRGPIICISQLRVGLPCMWSPICRTFALRSEFQSGCLSLLSCPYKVKIGEISSIWLHEL